MIKLITLIFCHLIGDYVLQTDFIAKNKRHKLVPFDCTLYVILFAVLCNIWFNLATPVYIYYTYGNRSDKGQIQQN